MVNPSVHAAVVNQSWVQRYHNPANTNTYDFPNAIAVDAAGNVVVTGNSNNDMYTAKYAATNGTLLWERRLHGPGSSESEGRSLALDFNGNVVVTGYSANVGGIPEYNYYTAKYAAADGTLLWEKFYNGPANSFDAAYGVAVDGSGNIVVTGSSFGIGTETDYYTAKYAAGDGTLLWEKRYNGLADNGDRASALAFDRSNNVVVTGYSSKNGNRFSDCYTAKYSAADGGLLWEHRYIGPQDTENTPRGLAVDGNGNVVITASSGDLHTSAFYTAKYASADGALLWEKRYNASSNRYDSPLALALDSSGSAVIAGISSGSGRRPDYYLAKLASFDGSLVWEKRMNEGEANAVAVDGSGNIIVTGDLLGVDNHWDCYTAKYAAADGALIWEARFNGPANGNDYATALALGPNGMVAIAGHSDRTLVGQGPPYDYLTIVYRELTQPDILTQPESRLLECTATNIFSISATGTEPLSYQWFFNRTSTIPRATNSTLAVVASTGTAGNYSVVVSNGAGSVTSVPATLTVVDTTPPVVTLNGPANLTVECHSLFSDPGATATDSCAGLRLVGVLGTVNSNAPGIYLLRYVASDSSGNSATNTRIVTVRDTTAPVLSGHGTNMTINCPATPVFTTPMASDTCDPNPLIIFTDTTSPGPCAGVYAITRSWVAIDRSSNTSAPVSQTITVQDITAPILSGQGTNMIINCPATPVFTAPTASDNCDPSPTITFTDIATPIIPARNYIINRTWLAVDHCGNTSAPVSQAIIVQDATAPDIICPTNVVVEFTDAAGSVVNFAVSARDACDSGVVVRCDPESGSTFAIGTTTVRCSATDASRNSASCNFTVTVLGARGLKENVLAELLALRTAVTNKPDSQKIDEAVEHLTKSLDAWLWVDQIRLERKRGYKVIQEEKETVTKLCELIRHEESSITDAELQGWVDRIVEADRLLAVVAIQDAVHAGVAQKKIDQARKELAKGDSEAADDKCGDGIEHYRQAWARALHATMSSTVHLTSGHMQLEILGDAGQVYLIQASTNLTDWATLATRAADNEGVIAFEDAEAGVGRLRFYRVREP